MLSVLVPTHNSIKYIDECIKSIRRQTLRDLEIICIDSSSDRTIEYLTKVQRMDSRLRIIVDDNASYGHKMNRGIAEARGDYIAIVESDDYIESDMMEKLYTVAKQYDCDLVKSDYKGFIDWHGVRYFCPTYRTKADNYNRMISLQSESNLMPDLSLNIWCAIYKKRFLEENSICFHESEGASYQDIGFALLGIMQADKIYLLNDCFYNYRMDNEGSSVKLNSKYKAISLEYQWLFEKMNILGIDTPKNRAIFGIRKLISFYWNYDRLTEEYRRKLTQYVKDESLDNFEEEILDYAMPDKMYYAGVCLGNKDYQSRFAESEMEKLKFYSSLVHLFLEREEIVIVSAGSYGSSVSLLSKILGQDGKVSVCDNKAYGNIVQGFKVMTVEDAVNKHPNAVYIIANKSHYSELTEQLRMLRIAEHNILICNHCACGVGILDDFNRYIKKLVKVNDN